ncbi:MAG: hypothetical protein ABSH56_21535 [Bryobacteraceae bacterium]
MLGALDIFLLPDLDRFANRFGGSLDRFSGDFQARQKLQLVPALSEGRHAAYCREHAPHARREVRLIDVQFHVGGELPRVACGAQVIGSVDACPSHHGENRPRTHSFISGDTTASARNAAMVAVRWGKAQQFGNGVSAGLVDRGANRRLRSLKIQLAGLVPVGENPLQLLF